MEIRVAVPAVPVELGIVADVVGEEDAFGVSVREELAEQLDDPSLAVSFDRVEGHAEEVELDVRAAVDDLPVVLDHRV